MFFNLTLLRNKLYIELLILSNDLIRQTRQGRHLFGFLIVLSLIGLKSRSSRILDETLFVLTWFGRQLFYLFGRKINFWFYLKSRTILQFKWLSTRNSYLFIWKYISHWVQYSLAKALPIFLHHLMSLLLIVEQTERIFTCKTQDLLLILEK